MSNKLVKRNNMENVTFEALGLDSTKNFLVAPKSEGKKYFMRTEDIKQASGDMLMEQDFQVGGILVLRKNGDVLFTLKKGLTNNDIRKVLSHVMPEERMSSRTRKRWHIW